MKQILYIGNKSALAHTSAKMIDRLGAALATQHPVRLCSDKSSQLLRLLDMWRAVWRFRRDTFVVLIDTYSTLAFWYAWSVAVWCQVLRLPYIPILHGGNLPERLKKSPFFCRILFGKSYANISPSRYLAQAFAQEGYGVQFIPNFINLRQYPFQPTRPPGLRLFWLRAYHPVYNPELAVEVLALVRQQHPGATLCMIGPDSGHLLEKTRQKAAELGLEEYITFYEKLPLQTWMAHATDATILLNTTNHDNMPVGVIEAMALGLPVVSTNAGGLPYLLEHETTALLTPCRDALAMAEAVLRVANDPALANTLARNGRSLVESFDEQPVMQQWFALLAPLACS